jgi:uncharacterized protein
MIVPVAAIAGDRSAPLAKVFRSAVGTHLLIVPHSRIFDVNAGPTGDDDLGGLPTALVAALADSACGEMPLDSVVEPAPQSVSLNVSSSCNLSCSYCYAARGSFDGAQPQPMSWEVARAAIDRLLRDADPTSPITVGFLGGEPFVNRRLIHRAVAYAASEGRMRGLDVRFSVTTNGTLLEEEDVDLLRRHPFAVTVSVDGGPQVQNRQRPAPAGRRSYDLLQAATAALLANPGSAQIAARATVKAGDFNLQERLDAIVALGFQDIGFAPLRSAGPDQGALRDEDWSRYLLALIAVARSELARAGGHSSIRLTNLAVALKQLHRGASSPYPCGAGGGYFSVAANGDWYACHRAIGSPAFRMGDAGGLDGARRRDFLSARHVHSQPACRQCWARYLCSGGCHQEASTRTDSSCGFIRGWLKFCLGAYCELSARAPEVFGARPIE